MSIKSDLRNRLNSILILDADLDEFLIDYFEEVQKAVSKGMSRKEKINLLFSMKEVSEIEAALEPPEKESALPGVRKSPQKLEESAHLRKEVTRLQHVIRELEQQLGAQKSPPIIGPRNGLERILKSLKDIEELSNNPPSAFEQKWMTIGHNALSSTEAALGKYHNISCDFRIRFMIEKEPFSPNYQALLSAAASILRQEVDEKDRASASWTTTLSAANPRGGRGGFFP